MTFDVRGGSRVCSCRGTDTLDGAWRQLPRIFGVWMSTSIILRESRKLLYQCHSAILWRGGGRTIVLVQGTPGSLVLFLDRSLTQHRRANTWK